MKESSFYESDLYSHNRVLINSKASRKKISSASGQATSREGGKVKAGTFFDKKKFRWPLSSRKRGEG